MNTFRSIVVLCFFWVFTSLSLARVGGIRGVVIDSDFEVPLPGVKVLISETGKEAVTGDAGSFYLEGVEPGNYTLMFSKGGYTRFTQPGVVVSPGQLADVEAALAGEYEEMDELVVKEISLGGASEIGLLNLRMESSALMDSVGADLMSRAGASDAAGALRLVAGATVEDGKYPVIRGLPDRYVSTQMNGIRLPTADPDKRAVQLDQFPSSVIESIQVTKSFSPDQQGEATGGAVNILLKNIPEEPIVQVKVGTKYRTGVYGQDFLSYEGGGVNTLGKDDSRNPQEPRTPWTGAVGVKKGDAPLMYDWNVLAGGRFNAVGDLEVGGYLNVYYKRDAENVTGTDDKYWVGRDNTVDGKLVPAGLSDTTIDVAPDGSVLPYDEGNSTSLFDVHKSKEEVQWGTLAALGAKNQYNELKLQYMLNHSAEDKATLAEDTRGKEYVYPGYDPYDPAYVNQTTADHAVANYQRRHTLEYIERETETLQLGGKHVLPVGDIGGSGFLFLDPEIDWILADSSSSLYSPDKRLFGTKWTPSYDNVIPAFPPWLPLPVTNTIPSTYDEIKGDSASLGNVQRIWKDVDEDSHQASLDLTLPFEQWTGDEGAFKFGGFFDDVKRTYKQDTYSNIRDNGQAQWEGDWSEYWTDVYPTQAYAFAEGDPARRPYEISAADIDVNYDGFQKIWAVYPMMELPVYSQLSFTGGARFEKTEMSVEFDAEDEVRWTDDNGISRLFSADPPPNVPIDQLDILPAVGAEFKLTKTTSLKANYGETIARPTFKEYTPIQYFEYLGGDLFIGNSALKMSSIKNYDLRFDWAPHPGGLVSVSWFYKDIQNPIEYTQKSSDATGVYTTSVNYPEGTMNGFEFEIRQQLGEYLDFLDGIALGANMTLIDSEVTVSEADKERQLNTFPQYQELSRPMLNAPEHLYNINVTYDINKTGTKLGLFYIVKGDTLLVGSSYFGNYVPNIYGKEFGTLNFSVSQKLGKHLSLSFKAKNLTDPEIQTVYRSDYTPETLKSSFQKGIEYSIGLTGKF